MAYALHGLSRDDVARADRASRPHAPSDAQWLWLAARLAVIRRGQAHPAKLPRILTPADASALAHRLLPTLKSDPQEQAIVIALDTQKQALAVAVVYRGTLNRVPGNASSILRVPLLVPSIGFVFLHSHPQGDPRPGARDLEATKALAKAADLVGLQLVDHVVITPVESKFYSVRERHPELWKE